MAPKKISQSDIIGSKGIALIHRIVNEMGFIWNPTGLEAGIDGYIEIRDPVTGVVTNCIIQVQSKATERDFQMETSQGFDYLCDARDLDYWLGGNAPVILIRSRPSTNEAYWVSLKDYFKDLFTRGARKIHFDKAKDRFDINCREALISLAKPEDSGIYLSPLPKQERLYSNLLEVKGFTKYLYTAETSYRLAREVWNKFKQMDVHAGNEWILKNKRIISFHKLEESPWFELCDAGTLNTFHTEDWAFSDDSDRQREFVQLLNRCLQAKLRPMVLYSKKENCYCFHSTKDLSSLRWYYKSLAKETSRLVFQPYVKYKNRNQVSHYRHSAFSGQFVRLENSWFLEITPTYYFTSNGLNSYLYGQDRLKGIKRIERNPAVLGQVVMWAEIIRGKVDLFTPAYSFMTFGSLASLKLEAGLDDKVWLGREEIEDVKAVQSSPNQLSLFDLLSE